MIIAPEIRLIIYEFVFSPPYNSSANKLSILAACRQIHGEAIITALRQIQFHIDGQRGLNFQPQLRSLGDLAQQLRRVNVTMPIKRLDASSANNPFVLTDLPLDVLHVDLQAVEAATWLAENRIYHRLVSALFHRTVPPGHGNYPSTPVHSNFFEKYMRRYAALALQPWAEKENLYRMLFCMTTKKVLVKCKDDGKDLFWSAFTHFELVEGNLNIIQKNGEKGLERYVMFWDENGSNVLEMGSWDVVRQ
tara:strand:+ start:1331 stop:2077 length:747 start_codon:yes stop_codon:yes gene_type:complete